MSKLKSYDPSTKEITCKIIRTGRHIHFVSDRALGPGEPNFHAYDGDCFSYSRIEASTDRTYKVPGLPIDEMEVLSWLMVQHIRLEMRTYLKTLTMPEEHEIDEMLENGNIFLGLATSDGKSDGATCIVLGYAKS